MNIFQSINNNKQYIDSFQNFNEDQVQSTFNYCISIIQKETSSLWDQMYSSYLPPAIAKGKLTEIPNYFKKHSENFLINAQKFFFRNKDVPYACFMLGLFNEYYIDYGKITQETYDIYRKGASKNDPFCMVKVAEFLIRENANVDLRESIAFLIKSFLITSIEPYRFIPDNILICFHNEYFNMDSLWYLAYFYETENTLFNQVLKEVLTEENCSNEFFECIKYIFSNIYKLEELVNILKKLEDCFKTDNNTLTAFHFCMFSLFISRVANFPINMEYIISILKEIADQGNYFACEKYAFYLDLNKDYENAFNYFSKAQENLMPFSNLYLGNYYCSLRNPNKMLVLPQAEQFYLKSAYLGFANLMEYMKILDLNKRYEELFNFANFSYSCSIFGSELVLGECYEKGKGIEKNLYIALSLYKRGLKKHKGGSGFLYRLSRILEKLKNKLSQEFYKISFCLYLGFFEKDRGLEDNIWILDAYRIASMIYSGRGVPFETEKIDYFLGCILNANINIQTSSYTCLFHHILKIKKNNLTIFKSFSSLKSSEKNIPQLLHSHANFNNSNNYLDLKNNNLKILNENNIYSKNYENSKDSDNIAKTISNLSKINQEAELKLPSNMLSNNNNNNNKNKNMNKAYLSSHESDFNIGIKNDNSSDQSIKIQILNNTKIKRKNKANEYIKICFDTNKRDENFNNNNNYNNINTNNLNCINNLSVVNSNNNFKNSNYHTNLKKIIVNKTNIIENTNFYIKENQMQDQNLNVNICNEIGSAAMNQVINVNANKDQKMEEEDNEDNQNLNENRQHLQQLNSEKRHLNIYNKFELKSNKKDVRNTPISSHNNRQLLNEINVDNKINCYNNQAYNNIIQIDDYSNNKKSSNVTMTILTESENSCLGIEDFFLSNLKLINKKKGKKENIQSIPKLCFDNKLSKNNNKNIISENPKSQNINAKNNNSNNENGLLIDKLMIDSTGISSEDFLKLKSIFKKIKANGVEFIELSDLIFDELLANGGYSKVYCGWHKNNKVAIKEFKNISIDNIVKIFQEIEIQTSLKNDKINKILCVGLDTAPIKVCSINNYISYNLRSVILNIKLDLRQKLFITQQLIEVVSYLHSQTPPIVHRDLKPENILIGENLNLELCDFGIYKFISNNKSKTNTENRVFTVRYAPPEVINSLNFICKGSDIWSLGLILYDIFYEVQPWNGLSSDSIINAIKKQRPFIIKNNKNVPNKIIKMIKQCTIYEYDQRPKISELKLQLKELLEEELSV